MRIISIEDAIKKGLVYESDTGLCLTSISKAEHLELKRSQIIEVIKEIATPSVLVLDDESKVLSQEVKRETNIGFSCRTQTFRFSVPRVYTGDNTPVVTCGITSGKAQKTMVIQDDKDDDIEYYHISIKRANGKLKIKEKYEKQCMLDMPLVLSYSDGELEVNGRDVSLGSNERLPFIGRDDFGEFEFEVQLPDGRKSELTYGLSYYPSRGKFCENVIQRIEKLKCVGGIDPEKVNIGDYDGNPQRGARFFVANPIIM